MSMNESQRKSSADLVTRFSVSGTEPDQNDIVINYKQGFPFRPSLSADKNGAKGTGKCQCDVTLSYDNRRPRGHKPSRSATW